MSFYPSFYLSVLILFCQLFYQLFFLLFYHSIVLPVVLSIIPFYLSVYRFLQYVQKTKGIIFNFPIIYSISNCLSIYLYCTFMSIYPLVYPSTVPSFLYPTICFIISLFHLSNCLTDHSFVSDCLSTWLFIIHLCICLSIHHPTNSLNYPYICSPNYPSFYLSIQLSIWLSNCLIIQFLPFSILSNSLLVGYLSKCVYILFLPIQLNLSELPLCLFTYPSMCLMLLSVHQIEGGAKRQKLNDTVSLPTAVVTTTSKSGIRRSTRHRKLRGEKALIVSANQTLKDLKIQVWPRLNVSLFFNSVLQHYIIFQMIASTDHARILSGSIRSKPFHRRTLFKRRLRHIGKSRSHTWEHHLP